jgi:hypothetical protein
LVPVRQQSGEVVNRLYNFDVFDQTWLESIQDAEFILGDTGDGVLYGGLARGSYWSVYELMNQSTGSSYPSPLAVTKSFEIVLKEEGKSRAVGWLRKFRVDCTGDWDLEFYVDGELVLSQSLTDQDEGERYQWYDFPPKVKGRYLTVKIEASGSPVPQTAVFRELEVV